MAGDFSYRAKDVLEDMLTVCSLRGKHSTGVAGISTRSNTTHIAKAVGLPQTLFEMKAWDRITPFSQNILIGHCRHATRGGITLTNAHPFQYGTIVGAHNGTLQNESVLEKTLEQQFNTDSQALYAHMNEFGVVDTIAEVRGAWALTWYDAERKTLNFLRNDERPLWYCFSKDCNKLFWASELWMLQGIMGREGIELWENEKGAGFFSVPLNSWLEFEIPESGSGRVKLLNETTVKGNESKPQVTSPFQSEKKERPKVVETQAEIDQRFKAIVDKAFPKPDPKPILTVVGSTTTKQGSKTSNQKSSDNSNSVILLSSPNSDHPNKSEDLDDLIISGPKGNIISLEEFDKLTRNGCIWCNETIVAADSAIIKWIDEDAALCPSCSGPNSEASQYVSH